MLVLFKDGGIKGHPVLHISNAALCLILIRILPTSADLQMCYVLINKDSMPSKCGMVNSQVYKCGMVNSLGIQVQDCMHTTPISLGQL